MYYLWCMNFDVDGQRPILNILKICKMSFIFDSQDPQSFDQSKTVLCGASQPDQLLVPA